MPQNDRLPACPGCEEPPEAGDLFCGACGTDLREEAQSASRRAGTPVALGGASPAPEGPRGSSPTQAPADDTSPTARPALEDTHGGTPVPEGPREDSPTRDPGDNAPATPTARPTLQDTEGGTPAPERPRGSSPTQAPADDTSPAARPALEDTPGGTPVPEGPRGDSPAGGSGGSPPENRDGAGPGGDHDTSAPAGSTPCVACGTGSVTADGHCTHCGHKQPAARDHWERELPGIAGASDRGLRHRRNEDFFTVHAAETPAGERAGIAVVCDGVSSARRSDQASEAAAEAAGASMRASIPRGVHAQQAMHDALVAAAGAVDALATEEEREAQRNAPACTIVGAVVTAGILTVGWVGDSRAYWVPDDRSARPARLTEDDSWAAQMVAAGLMSEAQAYADSRAHAITGWLGADAYELDPHTASFQPDRPGVVIVCTDGLWNYAESAEQMAAAVPSDAADRPLAAARHLVGFALDGGGHDNVTVAVVPLTTARAAEPAP